MQINSPALLGSIRALGILLLITALSFLGNVDHLHFLGNSFVEGIISMVALAIEHSIENKTGSALFGAIKTR